MNNSYQNDLKYHNTLKLNNLRRSLPYFCEEFFIGIESRTSILTRINYAYDLIIFFNYIINNTSLFNYKKLTDLKLEDLDKITVTNIEYFLDYLNGYTTEKGKFCTCSATAKARKLSTIRAFYKYYYNKERINNNPASKIKPPKIKEKPIIRLENEEVSTLLNVVETGNNLTKFQASYHNATKIRDIAIITLFLTSGIRISELVGIDINDLDFNNKSFVVTRKGGNQVILYLSDEAIPCLLDYIDVRNEQLNKKNLSDSEEPALFLSLQNKRISIRAVENLVKKYAKIAAPLKKITPHKLRSTYGTALYRQTNDIYMVAEVLGHKDVNTTKKHYAAISEDMRKQAANIVKLSDK